MDDRTRRKMLARTMGIGIVAEDIKNSQPRIESYDTILRREIQDLIGELVKKGESMGNIISTLNQNPKYDKYTKYFSSWIENCQRKKQTRQSHEDEER